MGILVADRSKSHQACFWPAQSLVLYLGQPRCMPLLVRTRFELRQEENDLSRNSRRGAANPVTICADGRLHSATFDYINSSPG